MKVVTFLNVKGGVGKTTSAVNFAYILATLYGKKVLLVDLDKQGNTTMAYGVYEPDGLSVANLLVDKNIDIKSIIKKTRYNNIDILAANMSLIKATQEVLIDTRSPQQTRLRKHFENIKGQYDYCVIDCPTDLNMSTLNALAVTDDVLIPVKIDAYSFVGLSDVALVISDMREFNTSLQLAGCFVTMYQNTNINKQGVDHLKVTLSEKHMGMFNTYVRHTSKVQESTFEKPLVEYDSKCTATIDYYALVAEYLQSEGKNNG